MNVICLIIINMYELSCCNNFKQIILKSDFKKIIFKQKPINHPVYKKSNAMSEDFCSISPNIIRFLVFVTNGCLSS